ncbi:hypothetical protein ACOSP7_015066 [Xanthoceras sorbifolium]
MGDGSSYMNLYIMVRLRSKKIPVTKFLNLQVGIGHTFNCMQPVGNGNSPHVLVEMGHISDSEQDICWRVSRCRLAFWVEGRLCSSRDYWASSFIFYIFNIAEDEVCLWFCKC